MTDHVLLPVLEEFKKRLDKIEQEINEIKTPEQKDKLNMNEIKDYLHSINMA